MSRSLQAVTDISPKEGQMFFVALFRSWCHNAVSTFSLCLLAQAYEQAYNLLQVLYVHRSLSPSLMVTNVGISAELEMTVNMLIQIDKLVQLLESPVFTCQFPTYLHDPSKSETKVQQIFVSSYSNQKDTRICTSASTEFSCSSLKAAHLLH